MSGDRRRSSDDYYSEPYPRYEGSRYYREPYEERVLRGLSRSQDPYASRGDQDRGYNNRDRDSRRPRENRADPPPLVTITAPREEQRRSTTPTQRREPYPSIPRLSETPPPPRASRWGVGSFEDTFGDVPESTDRSNESLSHGPRGPPRDPFTCEASVADPPYGGGTAPRNPYNPGGVLYDQPRERDRRTRSLAPELRQYVERRHGREHDHHRSRMGEPWGLAEHNEYQERLRRRYGRNT